MTSQIANTKSPTVYNYIGAERINGAYIFAMILNTTITTPFRRSAGDPGYGGISVAGSIFNTAIIAIPGKVQGNT